MTETPDNAKNVALRFRLSLIIIVLSVAVLVGVIYWRLIRLEAPIPDDAGAQVAGLPQGYTAQGFPRLGSPEAPVLVEEFSSYACPHCRIFSEEQFPDLLDEIAAGQVQFVVIPVPHIGPGAASAARAVFCAGEQGKLWEMHDTLYAWQKEFLARTFDEQRLLKGAEDLGLDSTAFKSCLHAERTDILVDAAQREFNRRGLRGTPTFFINGTQVQNYAEFDTLGTLAEDLQAGS